VRVKSVPKVLPDMTRHSICERASVGPAIASALRAAGMVGMRAGTAAGTSRRYAAPAGEELDGAPRDAAASLRLEPTVQEGTSRGESGLPLFTRPCTTSPAGRFLLLLQYRLKDLWACWPTPQGAPRRNVYPARHQYTSDPRYRSDPLPHVPTSRWARPPSPHRHAAAGWRASCPSAV